jgi:hypothetical protein
MLMCVILEKENLINTILIKVKLHFFLYCKNICLRADLEHHICNKKRGGDKSVKPNRISNLPRKSVTAVFERI